MPRLIPALIVSALLAGCADEPPQGRTPYAPTAAMSQVLAERVAMNAKEPPHVSLQEARDVPSVTDAAQAIPNVAGLPAVAIEVQHFTQPTTNGVDAPISAWLYRPALAKDTPVILYFPSGTWATRSDIAADETSRQLATRTGWVVVTLRPPLAPEAKFPEVHDAAMVAYLWARSQLRAWGADPTRVVLAGEGPGANLALSTALLARDSAVAGRPVPLPDALLLITPWAGTSTSTPSMSENGGSQPLKRATVRWADRLYASGHLDDPRIDLTARTDFAQMPPTTFILAEMDPLRSGAETVAARMSAAGVPTDVRLYRGVTYDFFGLGAYVPEAAAAEDAAVGRMRATLARLDLPPPAPPRRVSRSRARR
jgi:acetyl esterase/lipase